VRAFPERPRAPIGDHDVMTGHVDLFDIVPWEYGFVHSGAVAWLLEREQWAGLVLGLGLNAPWPAGVRVVSQPRREVEVGPRRYADLVFDVTWPRLAEPRSGVRNERQRPVQARTTE
jgi:hypothetical protein